MKATQLFPFQPNRPEAWKIVTELWPEGADGFIGHTGSEFWYQCRGDASPIRVTMPEHARRLAEREISAVNPKLTTKRAFDLTVGETIRFSAARCLQGAPGRGRITAITNPTPSSVYAHVVDPETGDRWVAPYAGGEPVTTEG